MKYKFSANLDTKSIDNLISQINNYKNNILQQKIKLFLSRLADVGIDVCHYSVAGDDHHFEDMVVFEKRVGNKVATIIGRNDDLSRLHTRWYDGEGNLHTETISPIMALEFGTAGYALKGWQGTFAVTANHIEDESWFYYEDIDADGKPINKHYATAVYPSEPMYNAMQEMLQDVKRIAREVFG